MSDSKKASAGFTADEKAAMRERAKEQKVAARRGADDAAALKDVLAKIAEMPPSDREIAERIHELIMTTAPHLAPKTWYGQPAYAKDGKVVCFFQAAAKFKTRYSTLGFSDEAQLDDGKMWPTSWAITGLTAADEQEIAKLIKRAAG